MLNRVIVAALLAGSSFVSQGAAAQEAAVAPTTEGADPAFYAAADSQLQQLAEQTVATGPNVVTAADPRGTAAGIAIMKRGGNAADAAIATLLALTVVEPQSSGIGGGAFLVYHDALSGRTTTLDGRETAPKSATPQRFLQADGKPLPFSQAVPGGLSVGVPGLMSMLAETHIRWGKLSWPELFQPAISYAQSGVRVTPRMHQYLTSRRDMLAKSPKAARLFLLPDGAPLPVNHVVKQPELAETLRTLSRKGAKVFYQGSIGRDIREAVAHAAHNPATISEEDLAGYRVKERPSLCRPYRQVSVCTMGPPSAGGVAILQILAQIERFDLQALGPDNPLSYHLIAESQRLAYADREVYGGDSDFVKVPVEGLLSPTYIAHRSAQIREDQAMDSVVAGIPARDTLPLGDVPATTHMAAADQAGNVISVTSTIEGPFGSGLMAAGFMLNNQLTDFNFVPDTDGKPAFNRVQAGKRPRSSMAPVILLDPHGKAVAAFGAAGGSSIIAQVSKTIIAHVDWGLPPEQAIAAPQIMADRMGVRLETGTRLEAMAETLRALGHTRVTSARLPLKGNGLARDAAGWKGAADPRTEGKALAIKETKK